MVSQVSSNPVFIPHQHYQGQNPLFDADLQASLQIEPLVQDLQISACSLNGSPLFCIQIITTLQQCAKKVIKIEKTRQKAILKLEAIETPEGRSQEVECLMRSAQALYNKEMDRFRMIGVMTLGFLGSQIFSMKDASLADERNCLIDRAKSLSNVLKSVEDVYEATEKLRDGLIQKGGSYCMKVSLMSPHETWRYIRLRIPDGFQRRGFYQSVAIEMDHLGTSSDLARLGKLFCVTHPEEMKELLEEYTSSN